MTARPIASDIIRQPAREIARPLLRDCVLAALGALVAQNDGVKREGEQFVRALRRVSDAHGSWQDAVGAALAWPAPADAELARLAETLDLSIPELLAIELCVAVEQDLMTGRAVAFLQAPLGGSRPTVGLLTSAFGSLTEGRLAVHDQIATGSAVRCGVLLLGATGAPLPERTLSVPEHVCLALRRLDAPVEGASIGLQETEVVRLAPGLITDAGSHAVALGDVGDRLLVIRSGSCNEAKSAAQLIARARGERPVFLDIDRVPPGVGPWFLLRSLLPVFVVELAPGERKRLPALEGYVGPVVAVTGPDGTVDRAGGSALVWTLPVPHRQERARLWDEQLGAPDLAAKLAQDHRHGAGRITQLARLARHRAALRGDEPPTAADVAAAAWVGEAGGLDALAQAVPDPVPDEALVLPPPLQGELDDLLLRCRWRDDLTVGLGASAAARYHAGVRAMFVGPSGTGKTLAAAWLATRLGLPLYRVDLAGVTSKYIGETEKNLAQLLARAEQAEVILLFDEADSLFSKRTDVRDANDRFANAQTNYLLQRIEYYDGIVILTGNTRGRLDSAFTRRLDTVIEFPLPGPTERRDLWRSHLGQGHTLHVEELNLLAATADFGGGHIRNAVLAAAVRARAADRPIDFDDVLLGVSAELRKLGRQVPAQLRTPGSG